jgi:hypothetical protein
LKNKINEWKKLLKEYHNKLLKEQFSNNEEIKKIFREEELYSINLNNRKKFNKETQINRIQVNNNIDLKEKFIKKKILRDNTKNENYIKVSGINLEKSLHRAIEIERIETEIINNENNVDEWKKQLKKYYKTSNNNQEFNLNQKNNVKHDIDENINKIFQEKKLINRKNFGNNIYNINVVKLSKIRLEKNQAKKIELAKMKLKYKKDDIKRDTLHVKASDFMSEIHNTELISNRTDKSDDEKINELCNESYDSLNISDESFNNYFYRNRKDIKCIPNDGGLKKVSNEYKYF